MWGTHDVRTRIVTLGSNRFSKIVWQIDTCYLRNVNHTKLDMRNETDFPKGLQAADSWPDYIQRVSAEYWLPASHLALDECMVPFVGRSEEKSGKDRPIPVGSKIRVVFPTRLLFSVAMASTVATLEIGDAL